jgi:hypothetical protein
MRRVVVEVSRREDDLGCADLLVLGQGRRGDPAAATIAPDLLEAPSKTARKLIEIASVVLSDEGAPHGLCARARQVGRTVNTVRRRRRGSLMVR